MTCRSVAIVVLLAFAAVVSAVLVYRSWAAGAANGGSVAENARSATASASPVPATAPAPAPALAPSATTAMTAPQREVVPLTVYFPNRRYVESGDESLPRMVAERRELEVTDAGVGVDALARAALAALDAGPKSAAATLAIPERLIIRDVRVRDGIAYVDFSRAGLSGGSLEETLLVTSIVRTLTGVPQVRAVQFLVEGKPPETLMGHVTTTKPVSSSTDSCAPGSSLGVQTGTEAPISAGQGSGLGRCCLYSELIQN